MKPIKEGNPKVPLIQEDKSLLRFSEVINLRVNGPNISKAIRLSQDFPLDYPNVSAVYRAGVQFLYRKRISDAYEPIIKKTDLEINRTKPKEAEILKHKANTPSLFKRLFNKKPKEEPRPGVWS